MSVNLSSAEQFALSSAAERSIILCEKYAANTEAGLTSALQQLQLKIMEGRRDGRKVEELMAEEKKMINILRESNFKHSSKAQSQSTAHSEQRAV